MNGPNRAGKCLPPTFRLMNCGPLIGQRTSGNLASTGGFRLLDGGVVVYPAEGKQDGQGESVIENIGVFPDMDVSQPAGRRDPGQATRNWSGASRRS